MRYLLLLLLAGCAVQPRVLSLNEISAMSSAELCWGASYAQLAENRQSAAQEVKRRNYTCTQRDIDWTNAKHQAAQDRRQRQSDAINAMSLQLMQQSAPPQTTTQTYIINGKIVTCTTTGSVTNCF